MSTSLQFRLTSAGQQAAWNAQNTGLSLELTHVQFGSGNRVPDGSVTALVTPKKHVPIAAGSRVSPNQIRLSAILSGTDSFNIAEIGVWKGVPGQADSVLFAYWSQASGSVAAKAPGVDFIFSHDMVLSDAVAAGSVTVVADTSQSAMLAMMAAHEAKTDPHMKYASKEGVQQSAYTFATATGTADAIVATFNPEITTLTNGMAVYVRASAANTSTAPTIKVGAQEAVTIVKGSNLPLVAGDIAGTGYWMELVYDATWGKWVLQNPATGVTPVVPPGTVQFFAMSSAPSGYLKANGAVISRSAYAALFAAIGTTFGAGDGSTTFKLPDLRGEFLRGFDDGRGVDSGRAFGAWQSGSPLAHDDNNGAGAFNPTGLSAYQNGATGLSDHWVGSLPEGYYDNVSGPQVPLSTNGFISMSRPRNVALLACIKY